MGTVNPIADLCARARKLGVTTLVDAAQSAGHKTVDVQAIGCDFLAFSGHKICGPTGIGILWGRQELLDAMPPYQGGGEMILSVEYQKTEFKPAPHRFEAGTPDISGPIGLHVAMDYLDKIGRENIWQHDQELAAHAYEKLAALKNIRLFGPKTGRAGLVSFLIKGVHAHDVVTLADQAGVALRGGIHRPRQFLFLQHQGRGGPLRGSGEGDSEVFCAVNFPQIKCWQVDGKCVKRKT
jgi:cysteine desulfurase/selenocysteine lyase